MSQKLISSFFAAKPTNSKKKDEPPPSPEKQQQQLNGAAAKSPPKAKEPKPDPDSPVKVVQKRRVKRVIESDEEEEAQASPPAKSSSKEEKIEEPSSSSSSSSPPPTAIVKRPRKTAKRSLEPNLAVASAKKKIKVEADDKSDTETGDSPTGKRRTTPPPRNTREEPVQGKNHGRYYSDVFQWPAIDGYCNFGIFCTMTIGHRCQNSNVTCWNALHHLVDGWRTVVLISVTVYPNYNKVRGIGNCFAISALNSVFHWVHWFSADALALGFSRSIGMDGCIPARPFASGGTMCHPAKNM